MTPASSLLGEPREGEGIFAGLPEGDGVFVGLLAGLLLGLRDMCSRDMLRMMSLFADATSGQSDRQFATADSRAASEAAEKTASITRTA